MTGPPPERQAACVCGPGRRSLDMPSPGRNQGPLDPATKVLEMESLGVKVGTYACACLTWHLSRLA